MLIRITSLVLLLSVCTQMHAQQLDETSTRRLLAARTIQPERPSELVDFEAFMAVATQAQAHRQTRLINLDEFNAFAADANTVILDTRSEDMYERKHIKGAVHLNFSDFTEENLRRFVPSPDTRILIYCNNNFDGDQANFASKIGPRLTGTESKKPVTLALNIPTYINLYGYGYENVYELQSLVDINDPRLVFEGSAVRTRENKLKKKSEPSLVQSE
jgi:rhodanese-related sulfurtransferase